MTQRIIYHDFQKETAPQGVVLTASMLEKGRRLAAINHGLNIACITVCGVCLAISVFVFGAIFVGM